MATKEAIWRRCRARASRKDRLMAQERGTRAREVLVRRMRCLWRGQGTWLVGATVRRAHVVVVWLLGEWK
jgi:hypothetical protein